MQMIIQLLAAGDEGAVFWLAVPVVMMIVMIIAVFYVVFVREKKRTGRLEVTVAEMGLEFQPLGDPQLLARLGGFPLIAYAVSFNPK